jgi:hypothetical protein
MKRAPKVVGSTSIGSSHESSRGRRELSAAAKLFKVPPKTLDDPVKGCVQHGFNPGPNTVLTAEEENVQAAYLLYMAERGFPLTTKMTQAFAWVIAF